MVCFFCTKKLKPDATLLLYSSAALAGLLEASWGKKKRGGGPTGRQAGRERFQTEGDVIVDVAATIFFSSDALGRKSHPERVDRAWDPAQQREEDVDAKAVEKF